MGLKLLSVDIEISDVFEFAKHEDMEKYAPFHISVAATAVHSGVETVWYSPKAKAKHEPALNMTRKKAKELLEYLADMQNDGFMICAWNGLGFDLKWIGHVAEDMKLAARIALKSYDPMFQFFNGTTRRSLNRNSIPGASTTVSGPRIALMNRFERCFGYGCFPWYMT